MYIETWKPIRGFEGIYSVSDRARVCLEIKRQNKQAGSTLSKIRDRDGYFFVRLSKDGIKSMTYRVARLVADAFIKPIPPGMQVNHKNGRRDDDRPENLEIVTCAENIQHSIAVLGHTRQGEQNPAAKMTAQLVVQLREERARGNSVAVLADKFGLTYEQVRNITTGKAWRTVGGPFTKTRQMRESPKEIATRITAEMRNQACDDLINRRKTAKQIAQELNVTPSSIYNWVKHKSKNA